MITIALYSMKGGVGKTAAAVNLAHLASADGFRTLICDLDPQGASSWYFRIKAGKNFNSNKFIKGGRSIDENIKGTDYPDLDLLPSKLSFRNLDLALDDLKKSKTRLRKIFSEVSDEYDFLFLDCPPGISLVSENVLDAAHIVLVPLVPSPLSVLTFEKLSSFLHKNDLDASKVYPFFSMAEPRKSLHRETMEKLSSENGNVLSSVILYRSDVERMGVYREPLTAYMPDSFSAKAYAALWSEVKELSGSMRESYA